MATIISGLTDEDITTTLARARNGRFRMEADPDTAADSDTGDDTADDTGDETDATDTGDDTADDTGDETDATDA